MHEFFFNEDEEQNENFLEVPVEKKEEVYIVLEPFDPDKKTLADMLFESINEVSEELNDLKKDHKELSGRVDKINKDFRDIEGWVRDRVMAERIAREKAAKRLAEEERAKAHYKIHGDKKLPNELACAEAYERWENRRTWGFAKQVCSQLRDDYFFNVSHWRY